MLANLYYDILKAYFGCTAFAVKTIEGIIHARNLDWWTSNDILNRYTKIFNFKKNGVTRYKTIGWPGFVGALSGLSSNKFSITLNAVLSKDKAEIAMPISFLLRDILENARNYQEAKQKLEQTDLASDCLLLIAGTEAGEMAVIERTPSRNATRETEDAFIAVTNDYKLLENNVAEQSELQSTSCGRYDRIYQLLDQGKPISTSEALAYLSDEKVMMGITVQQMVLNPSKGNIDLQLPSFN